MNVTHKILSTGYHYVRATGYAHLFAQWPRGTRCDYAAVSASDIPPSDETIREFIEAAQRAADMSAPVPMCPRGQCPWSGCDCGD